MYRHRRMNIKRMMVSNTSYVVLFVLFCVSSFCVLCSTDIVLCFLFVCLRLVSCVQHILCCVFCLFVFVLCLVFNRYCVVFFVCLSSFCVLCSTDIVLCFLFVCLRLVSCVWWCSTHIVLGFFCVFVLVSCVHQILCSVLFVFVLCLVYGGVPHILWVFFCFFFVFVLWFVYLMLQVSLNV
jgi:hypothetical protein